MDSSLEHSNYRLGATINSDTHLYGTSIKDLKSEPYEKVLITKVYLTKLLMKQLVLTDNMEDNKRIQAVNKAEIFNRELLKEIGYSDKDISEQLSILEQTKDFNLLGKVELEGSSLLSNFKESCEAVKAAKLKLKNLFNQGPLK